MTSGRHFHEGRHRPRWRCAAALVAWCLQACLASAAEPVVELPPLRFRNEDPAPVTAVTAPLRVPLPPLSVKYSRGPVIPVKAAEVLPTPTPLKHNDKAVPICLDTVMRLARDQNGLVRLARERVAEAYAEQDLAAKRWLPEWSLGAGWWRHDGGIQDFFGNLLETHYQGAFAGMELRGKLDLRDAIFVRLEAQRKVSQQQGELSRFNAEQLLDAATTYIDLLAAQGAATIAVEAEAKLQRLLTQAKSLEKIDAGVRVEVARVESELGAQRILTRRLHEGARAAHAKLLYLLGLDPASELVVAEKHLVELRLVDVKQSAEALIQTALTHGPGVQETEAILGVLEDMRAKGDSPLHWLPTLEMKMGEGAFGAGPGGHMDWANRWDLGMQMRWNLTELITARERKRLGDLKVQQAHLSYQDLRGKLTLAVQEAHEAARSSKDQFAVAVRQIQHAEEAYNLSDLRLRENIKGRSPSEVLLAIRSLVGARLSYLHAIRDYDKAQFRLFVFTGAASSNCR